MDTKQVIIFSVAMAFVAFRLYQKYYKKDKSGTTPGQNKTEGSSFFASSKDDDYEPYSKK